MFESAKRKLERAEQHLRNFDEVLTAFMDSRPHRPSVKAERKDGNLWRLWIEVIFDSPLPADLPLILGDAIHNFRCALDHMVWELVALDGGTQNRQTKFPAGRSRVDFEALARGVITPRKDTKEFLVDLAVYPSGQGHWLYGVHALDNADKHTVITPVAHVSYIDDILIFDLATGERTTADPVYTGPVSGNRAVAYEAPPGFGIDANHKIYPTPDVFFPKVDVFPDEPVVATLAQISMAVEDVIRGAEHFVTTRTP